MNHFVYIRSDKCDDYVKDNAPHKFNIYLKAPLILKGFWTVRLVEFFCKLNSKIIYSNKNAHFSICFLFFYKFKQLKERIFTFLTSKILLPHDAPF